MSLNPPPSEKGVTKGTASGKPQSRSIESAIASGAEFLFTYQRADRHWCAELESNPAITGEYVMMHQMLGLSLESKRDEIVRYFRSRQNGDGSWGIAEFWHGDVSTTVEVYLALRILGCDRDHPSLLHAEEFILRHGGIEKVRVFTRIFLALFGLIPWDAIPIIPAELILMPPQAPLNIYRFASWARSSMLPLFVIFHHRPVYALPNGRDPENPWLDHLWIDPSDKRIPYSSSLFDLVLKDRLSWRTFFGTMDVVLGAYERVRISLLRKIALDKCTRWIVDHQEESGDWAGIFPPMINSVIALALHGYSLDSGPVRKGLAAIERFAWEDEEGFRIQACESPVWDTALSTIALIDAGIEPSRKELRGAVQWITGRQLRGNYGDWKVYRPELEGGGWAFEYSNSWYPDVDDTAAVVLMLLKQDPASALKDHVVRGLGWVLGMQNRDGGWAAFDVENNKLFLNEIPFSDMDSLCDPSSPDVTGRVLEAFGRWLSCVDGFSSEVGAALRQKVEGAASSGVAYLRRSQEEQGAWYGRWGVNYLYGTSNVLCGLSELGIPAYDPMVVAALDWLTRVQNGDGGWGESLASYSDPARWMGRGASTASQTAWALMGLLSYAASPDEAVERGVKWLISHQETHVPRWAKQGGTPVPEPTGGTWSESRYTATGFPNHFYLRYNLYGHYFPMMALGRYSKKFGRKSPG